MKAINAYPSYYDIDRGCSVIVNKILTMGYAPTTIVGLARGGLIPAVIISHLLESLNYKNVLVPVSYSSKKGNGDGKNHDNILPPISNVSSVLIVDDICDGGNTMAEVYDYYKWTVGQSVYTAALYYKESSIHVPNFFWRKIPQDSPWIIFPFESE